MAKPMIVRKEDEINKEGQTVVYRIGEIEIELSLMEKRRIKIIEEQETLMGRHKELSEEMIARQAKNQKDLAEEKAKQPDLPIEGPEQFEVAQ